MNLYIIKFRHYSQKDSREGIVTYLVAESDESVYEWLKSEPKVNDEGIYNSYKYKEDDDPTFKERIIGVCGEMYDEESEVSDLYYGAIQYGWELIAEGVYWIDIVSARRNLKINIIAIVK